MLATAAWDLGASEPSLPIGWSRGRDELVQEFPWTVANGQLVGRTAGEGQASWQDNSWVETPVFRFIDPGDASIEFDVMHDGFIPGTDTFLDCLIVTLQDAGASDDDSKSSNCASGEQLSVFEHTASQPIDVNVQHEPVNAEANKGYRLRFRASDYDESASNNGFRIGNLRITGIEPDANLVIEVATDRAQITAGVDTLQFEIRVTNFGPIDANNVVVSETLPLGLTITTTHCPQPIGQTCSLSTIASGASVEYSLTASTSRQLPIMVVSQFDVASSASDPVPSNNSAMATVSAISSPNSPPVAVDDTATTDENVVLTIPVSSLLVNDIDPDDELLSLTSLDDSLTRGSVTRVGDELIYDPNGAFVGLAESETVTDTFSYSADDGNGETASATVTVMIVGVNDPPAANDDILIASTTSTLPIQIESSRLLSNDADIDRDSLVVSSIDATQARGVVTLAAGLITYDPNGQFAFLQPGESAVDFFKYSISDGHGGFATATASVLITGAAAQRMPGDSNQDGLFDSSDLIMAFQAGEYEDDVDNNSEFAEGDWDGDGDFTSTDLIFAFQFGRYEAAANAKAFGWIF